MIKKHGFNQSMLLAIRYGPSKYAGQGFQQIADIQGSSKILILLEHLRANDDAGIDLHIQLLALQLEAHLTKPVLEIPSTSACKYITRTWLSTTWDYLTDHNLRLHVPDCWTPSPQHINDHSIMEIADKLFGSSRKHRELEQIQLCHKYLQVTMLSEIVDAGTQFCHNSV